MSIVTPLAAVSGVFGGLALGALFSQRGPAAHDDIAIFAVTSALALFATIATAAFL